MRPRSVNPISPSEAPAIESPAIAPALAAADNVPSHLALAGPNDDRARLARNRRAEESPASSRADAKLILAQAVAKLAKLDSYQVKMQRRERVGGVVQPEEDILLSIKRKPKAVRLEWTEGSSKGREVIFSPALDAKMIYVHQPAAAVIVPSVKIAVDSPLVMKNSRHTIAEAGFETILANLEKSQQEADAGQAGFREPGLQGAGKNGRRRSAVSSLRPPDCFGRDLEHLPRSTFDASPPGRRGKRPGRSAGTVRLLRYS